jgi:eukaryotic-like serine/threonine-protein kinase
MALPSGVRLGPYEIVNLLGAGGMGEVYKARDTRLARTVAIKVLPQQFSADPERRQRFEREARAVSSLNHPHICTLYDVGHQDGTDYLVMEYLEGETLARRIEKGALPTAELLRIATEIADALDKAHRQGVVHRDLKPGNIMLTKSGAKLLDFGLAKAAAPLGGDVDTSPTVSRPLTAEGAIVGTIQYMSPEQLEGKDADTRSDIFAFGAVLYEMATGKKAFDAKSPASLIAAILEHEPARITTLHPMAPLALQHVIQTCLVKDPEDRWQSAHDVACELAWIVQSGRAATNLAASPPHKSNRERLAWACAVIFAAVALLLGFQHLREARTSPQALHAAIVPPANTNFHLNGDDGAPMALSPDGSRIVFGAGVKLWVESLETGAVISLSGTEGARFPFWSPDGRLLAFFADGKLKTTDPSGGPISVLCDAPNPRGGAWGTGGAIVFAPNIRTGLYRLPASGGKPEPLTQVDESQHTSHRWPHFLPDGRHVLYVAVNHANPKSDRAGVYVTSIDGAAPVRLFQAFDSPVYASGFLLYVRETTLMAQPFDPDKLRLTGEPLRVVDGVSYDSGTWRSVITASQNGRICFEPSLEGTGGQLTWVDRSGKTLRTVGERSESFWLRLSPDGKRLAILSGDPTNDLWIYELGRDIKTRATIGAQITSAPVWSPDSRSLAFSTTGTSSYSLWIKQADAPGNGQKVFEDKEGFYPTDWSLDGRYLLYDKGNLGETHVWALGLGGDNKPFPIANTPFWEGTGTFSPDGRWVAFVSHESGRGEVYVTPFPAVGVKWQISSKGGTQPHWRRDGKELFYISPEGDLMAAQVKGAEGRLQVQDVNPLFRVNLLTGPRSEYYAYDASADGQSFLINRSGEAESPPITLVVHWTAELKK